MRVWLDEDEEQHEEDSSLAVPAEGTGTLLFVNRVRVAEERNTGKGVFDTEPLQHHCYVALMARGRGAKGQWVLPAVLDRESGISIIGEVGLQRLRRSFEGLPQPVLFPYGGVNTTDGRSVSLTQRTCMLKISVLTPWGQVDK